MPDLTGRIEGEKWDYLEKESRFLCPRQEAD